MINVLDSLGNLPVTTDVLSSLFPKIKGKNKKISELEKAGDIIRLKRRLYVVSPDVSRQPLVTELIANHLYAPSYVSMYSALRFYGLIPETVYAMQSMTIKHSRTFENKLGRFEYTCMSKESFPIGITQVRNEQCTFLIASPEKALCDLISASSGLNLRYKGEAETYLEEDLRIDMEAFYKMRPSLFREYAAVGKKVNSINTLIKLLER